jgi:hypothetical protein
MSDPQISFEAPTLLAILSFHYSSTRVLMHPSIDGKAKFTSSSHFSHYHNSSAFAAVTGSFS